jgi:hypothetical protein
MEVWGDADALPAVEDGGKRPDWGTGLPLGLSLPKGPELRYEPASPDSLMVGLCRRVISVSMF